MLGENNYTNNILKILGEDKLKELDTYVFEVASRVFYDVQQQNIFLPHLEIITTRFLETITSIEERILKNYTGYQYQEVNAVLRKYKTFHWNKWIKREYEELAHQLSSIIEKYPSLDIDVISYRGVELRWLSKYGITALEDLLYMRGKYIYDEGFTSTSLTKEGSFFRRWKKV